MKKKEFNERINEIINAVNEMPQVENMASELKERGIKDPFSYGMWCERNFEANLREDYERKTTLTSDFSIAEWCTPIQHDAVQDTLKRVLLGWCNSVEFFAELIIALNLKSWEHHARGNYGWSQLYAELFYAVKDLYFDWFDESHKKHDEAMRYYFDYVD